MRFSSRPSSIMPESIYAPASESPTLYKAYFFGPFRVTRADQPLGEPVWRRNKAKALLKWFLLHPGRMFSAAQLIEVFWPGISGSSGSQNLHVTIHYLRHLLEPDLSSRQESHYIHRNKNNFYWFELDESWWADIFALHHHQTAAKEARERGNTREIIAQY